MAVFVVKAFIFDKKRVKAGLYVPDSCKRDGINKGYVATTLFGVCKNYCRESGFGIGGFSLPSGNSCQWCSVERLSAGDKY